MSFLSVISLSTTGSVSLSFILYVVLLHGIASDNKFILKCYKAYTIILCLIASITFIVLSCIGIYMVYFDIIDDSFDLYRVYSVITLVIALYYYWLTRIAEMVLINIECEMGVHGVLHIV